MSIVQAIGLTKTFGAITAVGQLNLEVQEGEIFALVGPDGAGKTTALRLLTGLMDPTAGSAFVAGRDVAKHPNQVKDHIGYMAQRFGLYADLTVEENMAFYADLFGIVGPERVELSARLLKMTRLEPFGKRQAGKLSGGMKQKLALMCTLLHKPRVLFLDEPTNGVDPVSRRDFWAILYQLVGDGLTVFMTTAYLDEAERANRVAFLHLGKLIRCDTPDVLRRGLADGCYRVVSENLRETRGILEQQTGVVAVQPSGTDLHVFIDEKITSPDTLQAVTPFRFERVLPSLEDVFVNLVRHQEAGRAA
ncbi:MAG: ABC transporter ATP-binding protein [Bryobacterales bacterium]|nr:ABC transporter ATP-binding protein [Bryobacterales bacterium]